MKIIDLASGILPLRCKNRIITFLLAYFDESGIHEQYGLSPVTCIAGFIGTATEWESVALQWESVMKGQVFHYKDYKHEPETLIKLADILSSSKIQIVSAGFKGDWEKTISHKADWKIRFPSCYNALFEMCIEQMDRFSLRLWDGEPVALIFSEQDQYAKRAEEIWRTMRGNGLWQKIVSFTYSSPKDLSQLQTSDMISHEIFQCMKIGTDEVWQDWPLVKRLLANGIKGIAGYHTPETFIAMMENSESKGRQYLKNVPKA